MQKPTIKPNNPCFSSGPCAKHPGWSVDCLKEALIGRSHRAAPAKKQLQEVIQRHRELLRIPDDYVVGIVPASDTGAFEMAMWSLLGSNGADVLAWESFSNDWLKDAADQLKLQDLRSFTAEYGSLPDLHQVDCDRDVVFVWNGTTSGVRVPDADWIADDREGLTLCDATSAVFAYDMPWEKLDVVTWSWQKVLGGEAAHGMLVLSPRAITRLESQPALYALPKIFRMTKKGELNRALFEGATINTPSMLAVADCLDALRWVESIGGLSATIARCDANYKAVDAWVERTPWIEFLAEREELRSTTSVCLKIVDSWFAGKSGDEQQALIKQFVKKLEAEGAAYDIASYRDAPAGLRIWCGATVETSDVEALLPWLEWGYQSLKQDAANPKAA